MVETEAQSLPPTHIYCSFFWFGTDNSIKSGGVKLVLWAKSSHLSGLVQLCKRVPLVIKTRTHVYVFNYMISVVVKKVLMFYFIQSNLP
jgi:hypothetical protein